MSYEAILTWMGCWNPFNVGTHDPDSRGQGILLTEHWRTHFEAHIEYHTYYFTVKVFIIITNHLLIVFAEIYFMVVLFFRFIGFLK